MEYNPTMAAEELMRVLGFQWPPKTIELIAKALSAAHSIGKSTERERCRQALIRYSLTRAETLGDVAVCDALLEMI